MHVYFITMLLHQYILIHPLSISKIHITQISGICENANFVLFRFVLIFCVCDSALLKLTENNLAM